MNYFTLDDAVEIYTAMMRDIGGKSGFNGEQISRLDSVLVSIQNDDYYPKFADKLTHLIFSCVKFHPFLDGNKRSAIILAIFFMELNGVNEAYEEFALKMEDVVVEVAESKISKDELWQVVSGF